MVKKVTWYEMITPPKRLDTVPLNEDEKHSWCEVYGECFDSNLVPAECRGEANKYVRLMR